MYFDQYGIIGQIRDHGKIKVEGGDAANWHSHLTYFAEHPDHKRMQMFNISAGAWVRHPDPNNTDGGFGAYYKNPWNGCISRDQLTGILGYLIKFKRRKQLFELILHHMAWGFLFSYNTIKNGNHVDHWKWPDITGPDIWAMELRGIARCVPLSIAIIYPILVTLDIHLLLNCIYTNSRSVEEEDDVLAHVMKLSVALDYYPTPFALIAEKLTDKHGLFSKLRSYWGGWRRSAGMAKITTDYLRKKFNWPN
jgi:hypothetical protein